jgi:hypothetical protein
MADIASLSPRGYVLAAGQGAGPDRPDLKASADSTGGQLTQIWVFRALRAAAGRGPR